MNLKNTQLIAGREIKERVNTRSFKYGTLFTVLVVVAAVLAPALLRSDSAPQADVAIVGPANAEITSEVINVGATLGTEVTVAIVDSVAEGEGLLRSDDAELVVVPGAEIVTETAPEEASTAPTALAGALGERLRLLSILNDAGVSGAEASQALAQPGPTFRGLEPASDRDAPQIAAATGALVLVFIFILLYGSWILNGVIEDKTSRVVEVLLSTVRPAELLVGKVLGIATVAGLQGLAILVAALGAYQFSPDQQVTALTPTVAAISVMWLILGFGLYAWMYAAAGSMASRSQEAQSISFPLQLPLIAAYFISVGAAAQGVTNRTLEIASFVPFTAPMAMLVRMLVEDVPIWQVLASVGATVVGIFVVARLAIAIFSGSILRTGKRTKLREALQGAKA